MLKGISEGRGGFVPNLFVLKCILCFFLSPLCLLYRSLARATCVSNALFLPPFFFFLFIDFVYFLSEAMHVSPLSKVFHQCTKLMLFAQAHTHCTLSIYIVLGHGTFAFLITKVIQRL